MSGTCQYGGCERPYAARGWCHYHYHRAVNYGAPDALTAREQKYGVRLADDGYIDEIAVELAVMHGLTGRGNAPSLTRSERAEVIRQMHAKGCSPAQVARATGCAQSHGQREAS